MYIQPINPTLHTRANSAFVYSAVKEEKVAHKQMLQFRAQTVNSFML